MRLLLFLALALLLLAALARAAPATGPRVLHADADSARLFSQDTQIVVRRQGRGATLSYNLCPAPGQPLTLLRYAKYIEFAQLDGTADVFTTRSPMCEHDTCEMRVREANGCLAADLPVMFPVDLEKSMIARVFDMDGRLEYLFK